MRQPKTFRLGHVTRCICGASAAVSDAQHIIFHMRIQFELAIARNHLLSALEVWRRQSVGHRQCYARGTSCGMDLAWILTVGLSTITCFASVVIFGLAFRFPSKTAHYVSVIMSLIISTNTYEILLLLESTTTSIIWKA